MAYNPKSLANLNRNGRTPKKVKSFTYFTDEQVAALLDSLYKDAMEAKYARDRIAAASLLLDRIEGKPIPQSDRDNEADDRTVEDMLAEDDDE